MMHMPEAAVPACLEIEQEILSALLHEVYDHAHPLAWKIKPEMFFMKEHEIIAGAISRCLKKRRMTRKVAVIEQLVADGQLADAGGAEYINEIFNKPTEQFNLPYFVKTLIQTHKRREVIQAVKRIEQHAIKGGDDLTRRVHQEIDAVQNALTQMLPDENERTINLENVLGRVAKMVGNPCNLRPDDFGMETGFEHLDTIIGGLQPGSLHILGARPGMGMTNMALQIASHIAIDLKQPVGFMDFEASPENLLFRATSLLGGIDLHMMRQGHITQDEWQDIFKVHMDIMDSPLHFIPPYIHGDNTLEIKIESAVQRHGVKLVVIDSLNAYAASSIGFKHKELVTPDLTYRLKELARRHDISILCTLSMGPEVEIHEDKCPRLNDMPAEFGCVENADVVLFLTRPAVYLEPEDIYGDEEIDDEFAKSAFVKVARNRNGPIGGVTMVYEVDCGRFTSLAEWDVEFV